MSSFCAIHGVIGRIMEGNVENIYIIVFGSEIHLKGEANVWIGDLFYPYCLPLL
jgi:hypothetical protein